MNKKLRKILTLACSAVLLVCLSVGATVAYLTSSDSVQNTFSVGNVKITLDEAAWLYEEAETDGTRTDVGNRYKLLPGKEYVKDPTVTVAANSEKAYIRMLVTVTDLVDLKAAFGKDYIGDDGKTFLLQNFVTGWDNAVWAYESCTEADDGSSAVYEFRYVKEKTVSTVNEEARALAPLFKTIVMPGTIENEALATLAQVEINVVAQAIQAEGFADADAAWAAWED